MKKTAQTLLTAAMFATALGSSAANQTAGSKPAFAADNPYFNETTTTTMTTMMPLYGPPWVLSSLEEERQKTATTGTTTFTTPITTTETLYGPPSVFTTTYPDPDFTTTEPTGTEPVVLYGPPWVFYNTGDANMDDKADARDLTLIKRAALLGRDASFDTSVPEINLTNYGIADVNHDDVVDKEDVKLFMSEQLGIPPKEEEAVTTTTTDAILTGLETTTTTMTMPLYGPPMTTTPDENLRWDTYEDLHPELRGKTTTTMPAGTTPPAPATSRD